MNEKYQRLSMPPETAVKKIEAGKLKGKSDINPQWKIEAMTEEYGTCGIGWKFEVAETKTFPCQDGQVLIFMLVNLYIKDGDVWSAPVQGYGGDYIIEKNKNGLVPNDEAYKMCLTDALGNAMKCLGVAATVYRGLYDTKYAKGRDAQSYQSGYQNQPPVPLVVKKDKVTYVRITTRDGVTKELKLLDLSDNQLEWLLSNNAYAACHDEIRELKKLINSEYEAEEADNGRAS